MFFDLLHAAHKAISNISMAPTRAAIKSVMMIHHNVRCQNMATPSSPATQALQSLEERLPAPEYLRRKERSRSCDTSVQTMAKRRRTRFDMEEMLAVIKPVEESIAFPKIEWSYDDEDTSTNDNGAIFRSNSWDPHCSGGDTNERSRAKGLHRHRRSSSEFLCGKEARGESLFRAKARAPCLVSLTYPTNKSQALVSECFAALQAPMLACLPPTGKPSQEAE